MTKLLDVAFEKISLLDETEQNAIAKIILDETEYEKKWSDSFAKSEDSLSQIANEALQEYKNNQTEVLQISKL